MNTNESINDKQSSCLTESPMRGSIDGKPQQQPSTNQSLVGSSCLPVVNIHQGRTSDSIDGECPLSHPESHGMSIELEKDDQPCGVKSSRDSDDTNETSSLQSHNTSTIDSTTSLKNEETNGDNKTAKRSKSNKRKRDRSKLRKGKWTLEEEEYTSRIIHYFSTGLLTLPEGSTLRSYLADKLNCDPMRITKKYAGASCLGRRVYHFRDRVHPTIAEIQVAKVELDHLEQRFRLRIEGGQSIPAIVPLAEQSHSNVTQPNPVASPSTYPNQQEFIQALLLGMNTSQQNLSLQPSPTLESSIGSVAALPFVPPPPAVPVAPSLPPALIQLLLSNTGNSLTSAQNAPTNGIQGQIPVTDLNANAWGINQLAAALGPVLSQLLSANMQHVQQQQTAQLQAQQQQAQQLLAQQKAELQSRIQEQQNIINQKLLHLQSQNQGIPVPTQPVPSPASMKMSHSVEEDKTKLYAAEFKDTYNRHLKSLGIAPLPETEKTVQSQSSESPPQVVKSTSDNEPTLRLTDAAANNESPRTDEDKEGGTALLGFLSSLRKSYENVIRDKQLSESCKSESSFNPMTNRPATVTDSNSSQQRDSSVEDSDWNSDKKTDNSSSEDSDKEDNNSKEMKNSGMYHNQGPPRKRLKVKRVVDAVRKGPTS